MDSSNATNSASAGSTVVPPQCLDSGTMLSRDVSVTGATTMVQAADGNSQQQSSVAQRTVAPVAGTNEASSTPGAEGVATFCTFIVDGIARQCESVVTLLDEPRLLYKFLDSFTLYFDEPLPDFDALKQLMLTRVDIKNAFLLVNNITDCSRFRDASDAGTESDDSSDDEDSSEFEDAFEYIPAARRESALYNPEMACTADRTLSVSCHLANIHSVFLREFPCRVTNVMSIAEAGFYLSLAEQKLICHACGGSIRGWQGQWQDRSLKEVHAKLFPACSFLKAEFGQAFIDQSQQSVASGLEPAPCPLADYPNFYAVPPDKASKEAERDARDYLALLFRESHPVSSGREARDDLLPSFELGVDLCRYRLDDIMKDRSSKEFFYQLSCSVKKGQGDRLPVTLDLLQLLQDLLLKPTSIMAAISNAVIAAGTHREDPPEKRLREIKSKMVFIHCQKILATQGHRKDLCQLLVTLKTFFNESVLFRVLYNIPVLGKHQIKSTWSFDTRRWLQQHLSSLVCDFPSDDQGVDDQAERPTSPIMAELIKAFRQGIDSQADFINYLVTTLSGNSRFLLLLNEHAGRDGPGLINRSKKDLEHFLCEYVREYWDDIVQATTKHQTTLSASQGGD